MSWVLWEKQGAGDRWSFVVCMFFVTVGDTKHLYAISYLFHDFRKHAIPKSLQGKISQICLINCKGALASVAQLVERHPMH